MLYYITLYYTILYYIILCYIILHYIILYYIYIYILVMPSAWQKECNILSTIHSVDPVFFLSRTAGTDCILVGRSWYFMLVASRHSINHLLWCFEQVVMVLSQSCTITYILTSCDTYGKSKINKSHTSSKQAPIWGAVCRLKPLASTYNMPQGHVQILGNWYHLQNFTKQPLFFMFDLPFFAFLLNIWTNLDTHVVHPLLFEHLSIVIYSSFGRLNCGTGIVGSIHS